MKTISAFLLALGFLICSSRADRILIYNGSMTQKSIGASAAADYVATTGSSIIYIFDVDTSQYNFITYSDIKHVKTFHINSYDTSPFINSPFSSSSKVTHSTFIISTSTTSTPFTISTESFTGVNVLQNFGGTFTGEFPMMLKYTLFSVNGDGTLANDIQSSGSGMFHIDLLLTMGSNIENSNMAAAVDGVVLHLSGIGYTSE